MAALAEKSGFLLEHAGVHAGLSTADMMMFRCVGVPASNSLVVTTPFKAGAKVDYFFAVEASPNSSGSFTVGVDAGGSSLLAPAYSDGDTIIVYVIGKVIDLLTQGFN